MDSFLKWALLLPAIAVPAIYAETSKQAESVELAKPVLQAEQQRPVSKPAIDVAKPAHLKAVVTEPVFESSQGLQAIINAEPIPKPRKPEHNNGAIPARVIEPEQTEPPSLLTKDAALFEQVSKVVSKNDLAVQQPKLDNALILLDTAIAPGTATRLAWMPDQSFKGIAIPTPVLVVNGSKPGPAVCLTAAIHGDELNGIEIVRRVLYELEPKKLSGAVIGVPIVNLQGFQRHSRYLTDRRDLNRFFPGDPQGSSAARLAHSFFHEVISHCDALIDLHTGSFYRTNMPQLRANTDSPEVLALAKQFGATIIVHGEGSPGTLRRAAVDAGIPAVTLEAGESMRLQEAAVAHGVEGIATLLEQKDMLSSLRFWQPTEAIYKQSLWVRADQGGILFGKVKEGAHVNKGDVLGIVTDPITNVSSEITAPFKGRVIGLALNQVVMPGFATFHLGLEASNQIKPQAVDPLKQAEPMIGVEEGVEDIN